MPDKEISPPELKEFKELEKPSKKKYRNIVLVYNTAEVAILQEIADAFYKSKVIAEPKITKLLRWNVDRLVSNVIEKKKLQLMEQIKADAKKAADKKMEDELQKYRNLLGGPN